MAFSTPTFNLVCDIWQVDSPSTKSLRSGEICNLAMGRRNAWPSGLPSFLDGFAGFTPNLLLPAGVDIRDANCFPTGYADLVEVPAGTGRWYQVQGVDDVGKGFPNEYRFATLYKIGHYAPFIALGIPDWPVPIP